MDAIYELFYMSMHELIKIHIYLIYWYRYKSKNLDMKSGKIQRRNWTLPKVLFFFYLDWVGSKGFLGFLLEPYTWLASTGIHRKQNTDRTLDATSVQAPYKHGFLS